MQVRESSSLKDADSPQLLGLAIEDGTESGEGNGLDAVAVASHHRRRHGQRIENGFFRGFDRCRDQWVQMRIGEVHLLKRQLFRVMRNTVCGREGQHKVATAVARSGACARQSQRGTFRQSRELAAIERSIGADENDNGTLTLAW